MVGDQEHKRKLQFFLEQANPRSPSYYPGSRACIFMGERKGYLLCLLVALWFLLLWSAKVSLLWVLLGVELALALASAMEAFLQQS